MISEAYKMRFKDQWDVAVVRLKNSGYDLSKIKITASDHFNPKEDSDNDGTRGKVGSGADNK